MTTPYDRRRSEWRDTQQIRYVSGSQVTLTNTTTVTDVIFETVYANELGNNGQIRWSMGGTYLNNTGGSLVARFTVKHGGLFIYNDAITVASSATTRAWHMQGVLTYGNSNTITNSRTNTIRTKTTRYIGWSMHAQCHDKRRSST